MCGGQHVKRISIYSSKLDNTDKFVEALLYKLGS